MVEFSKSNLVRLMKNHAGCTSADIAKFCLHTSKGNVDSKLHRNSWSMEDIFKIANFCHVDLFYDNGRLVVSDSTDMRDPIEIMYFSPNEQAPL